MNFFWKFQKSCRIDFQRNYFSYKIITREDFWTLLMDFPRKLTVAFPTTIFEKQLQSNFSSWNFLRKFPSNFSLIKKLSKHRCNFQNCLKNANFFWKKNPNIFLKWILIRKAVEELSQGNCELFFNRIVESVSKRSAKIQKDFLRNVVWTYLFLFLTT